MGSPPRQFKTPVFVPKSLHLAHHLGSDVTPGKISMPENQPSSAGARNSFMSVWLEKPCSHLVSHVKKEREVEIISQNQAYLFLLRKGVRDVL